MALFFEILFSATLALETPAPAEPPQDVGIEPPVWVNATY